MVIIDVLANFVLFLIVLFLISYLLVKRELVRIGQIKTKYYCLFLLSKERCLKLQEENKHRVNPLEKIVYLPHFVELDKWKFKLGRTNKHKVLFVGRYSRAKGVHILINAMKIVTEKYPDTKLSIVGEGEDKKFIKNIIDDLNIKRNIEFVGYVPNEKLMKYYHNANVFVMPSLCMEQFGICGIEALACGTPCIGSNIGGIPEWCIHNKTGLLVKPNNAKQLAKRIIQIFEDKKLAGKFAINGRHFVEENHSAEAHIESLERIYENVIT